MTSGPRTTELRRLTTPFTQQVPTHVSHPFTQESSFSRHAATPFTLNDRSLVLLLHRGTGPYLDFSKYTEKNRGYTHIAHLIMDGNTPKLKALFDSLDGDSSRRQLANLVMTGGARPLHMCGMSAGGDSSTLIQTLIDFGAEVNAKDNYELTPVDRLASNAVGGSHVLRRHGAKSGDELKRGVPTWSTDEFAYVGPGNVPEF